MWFTCVYLDGGTEYLNNLLFNQTVNRAVDAFTHKKPFYFYAQTYWFCFAPWSLLAFATIISGYCKRMVKSTLLRFFATITASTVVMLSAFSSKLEIYMLPCFPFIIYGTAILLPQLKESRWIKLSVAIPAAIFILASAVSFVIFKFIDATTLPAAIFDLWAPLQFFTAILGIGGVFALYFIYKKNNLGRGINSIAISMLAMIFLISFSTQKLNPEIGLKEGCSKAIELAQERGIENYSYYRFVTGDNLDVYLGKQLALLEEGDLAHLQNSILFIKKKYIRRDAALENAVEGKEIYTYGEYAFILFPPAPSVEE